ncbi:MAG TPA: hypothetical protein H9881_05395 [Candidatus Stackebrandtia excrementipullorum]|nr:hypothetical protein [Candidatus Stackebrandtia excrementipullorum]
MPDNHQTAVDLQTLDAVSVELIDAGGRLRTETMRQAAAIAEHTEAYHRSYGADVRNRPAQEAAVAYDAAVMSVGRFNEMVSSAVETLGRAAARMAVDMRSADAEVAADIGAAVAESPDYRST